jgi:hypothetical protein
MMVFNHDGGQTGLLSLPGSIHGIDSAGDQRGSGMTVKIECALHQARHLVRKIEMERLLLPIDHLSCPPSWFSLI